MAVSNILAITQMTSGQANKYTTFNNALDAFEQASNKPLTSGTINAGPWTLSESEATRYFNFVATGASGAFEIRFPATISSNTPYRFFSIRNASSYTATVRSVTGGGATDTLVASQKGLFIVVNTDVYCLAKYPIAGADLVGSMTSKATLPVSVNAGETALEFKDVFDVTAFVPGTFTASQTCLRFVASRTFKMPINLTNSRGYLHVVPTGSTAFDLQKNGLTFGTATFAIGANTCTFTCASEVTFSPGDRLEIFAPGSPDASAASLSINLAGFRD